MLKILILRFSSIGDIVLTTPVVRALKTQINSVELHYATKAQFRQILEANPYISRLHLLENNDRKLIETLKKERFDYVVDLHKNLRTLRIKLALGVRAFSFDKLNFRKWIYVNFKINCLPKVHIVERYMQAVGKLGVTNDALGLDYFIPEKDEVEIEWLPETHRKKYVVVAIGGQHTTKKLPTRRLIELCDQIMQPIILLGGKDDARAGEKIEAFFSRNKSDPTYEAGLKALGKKGLVFNGCGKFSLNQSASLVRRAYAVFTHDTGLMHIAAAFKRQIFSIWGNTTPDFGMYPYRTKFTIFENNNLKCRPCSKIGYNKCPKKHFKCMNDVKFNFYLP